jgi:hypothetical protein
MTQPAPIDGPFSPEETEAMLAEVYKDTPLGYKIFYRFLWNRKVPSHCMEWVERIYSEERADRPVFLEAFRGSTKSTTITVTLAAYKIGNYPNKCGYIVNAVDEKANEFAEAIKSIIEFNSAWTELFFPHVVPDYARGWAQDGYNVKDNRVDYGEWVRKLSPDPTFVGYGAKSGSITGKHPSNWLIVDDIHNEENTRSSAEIQAIKDNYNAVINYTREPNNPLTIIVGTPWNDNDLYADIRGSKAYFHIRTPARKEDGTPTWPEGFGEEKIQKKLDEDLSGGVEPARMLFLDLTASRKREIVYQTYPSHLISPSWPMWGGADPASVADPTKRNNKQSHFALSYVVQSPENMAVVYDGILEQVSLGGALDYIEKAQSMFPDWQYCEIEGDGKGEDFFQAAMLKPTLKVIMEKTGGKSKAHRIVNILGAWTRIGKIRLSDASTPFLTAARNFANKYPAVSDTDPGWDAWDSIYRAVHAMPHVLVLEKKQGEIKPPGRKEKTPSPWTAVGAMGRGRQGEYG